MSSNEIEIIILGSSSGIPTDERKTSAQLLRSGHHCFLVDCGEGTQLTLRRLGLKLGSIDHIFITHLHGDHYFGLAPLMSTFHLMGRERPLHIYADPRLEDVISLQFELAATTLRYPVIYHGLSSDRDSTVFDHGPVQVKAFPLDHRIPTCGFRFDTRLHGGELISYTYLSDTRFDEQLAGFAKSSTLVYHEATFLEDLRDKAELKYHSTAADAARMAGLAGAGWLMIGHFSTRYPSPEPLLEEARRLFPNTLAASDGMRIRLNRDGSLNIRQEFENGLQKA